MPTFYVLSGPDLGKTFDVGAGAVIGRVPECDVVVRGGAVSRQHARLDRVDGIWTLVDLDSRNGIHSEGVRRKRIELEDGQLFEIGKLELRFRADVDSAPPARIAPKVIATPPPITESSSRPEPEGGMELEFAEDSDSDFDTEADEGDDIEIRFDSDDDDDDVDFGGEIEFEDEDLFDAPAPAPKAPPSPPRSAPVSRPAEAAPATAPARATTPGPQPTSSAPRRSMSAGGGGSAEVRDAGRPALQFSKHTQAEGFFSSDLSQYPLWVKWFAGLLALALFVGLFYVAFRASSSLKERAVGGSEVEDVDDSY